LDKLSAKAALVFTLLLPCHCKFLTYREQELWMGEALLGGIHLVYYHFIAAAKTL